MSIRERRFRMPAAMRGETLADRVAHAIIEAAVEGRIRPGDRLIENDVANELDVSRVPVREALRLLESQGIVVGLPYREMRLFDVDSVSLSKLLSVRMLIELYAVRIAVRRLPDEPDLVAPFESALEALRQALSDNSPYRMALADVAFHRSIYMATDNAALVDIWNLLARKLLIILGLRFYERGTEELVRQHEALLQVFLTGDQDEAMQQLRDHILQEPEDVARS
jgi:DNA-binding GntR family transcriptional regulator